MLMSVILTGANFVFPLITYPYVARVLLPEGTGKVAFALSVLSYFSWIAVLGIPSIGVRECAKCRGDRQALSKTVQELFIINLASTLVAYLLLFLAVPLVPRFRQDSALFYVMSVSIVMTTFGVEWLYQALEEYTYITKRSLIFKTISVGLIFLMVRDRDDYLIYGALSIFTTSASYLFNLIHSRKFVDWRLIPGREYKKYIRPIFALFTASIVINVYANVAVLLLGFLSGDAAVGQYNAALKIRGLLTSVSTAVTAVLIPRMAACYQNGREDEFVGYGVRSLKVSCALALPLALYVLLNTADAIRLICGAEYLPAVMPLKILAVCSMTLVMTNLFGNQMLIPMGRERIYTHSVVVSLFVNVALTATLVPATGATGAAVAALATEFVNIFFMGRGVRKEAGRILRRLGAAKYLSASAAGALANLALAAWVLPHMDSTVLRLSAAALAFFIAFYGVLILQREDIMTDALRRVMSLLHIRREV
jgi:O-antigen/teichoic acid export membrane protein